MIARTNMLLDYDEGTLSINANSSILKCKYRNGNIKLFDLKLAEIVHLDCSDAADKQRNQAVLYIYNSLHSFICTVPLEGGIIFVDNLL
jgi:hypothetical protein